MFLVYHKRALHKYSRSKEQHIKAHQQPTTHQKSYIYNGRPKESKLSAFLTTLFFWSTNTWCGTDKVARGWYRIIVMNGEDIKSSDALGAMDDKSALMVMDGGVSVGGSGDDDDGWRGSADSD